MEMLKRLEPVALFLMICGALNWGIVGITDGDTIRVMHNGAPERSVSGCGESTARSPSSRSGLTGRDKPLRYP